ncbi:hypothetical protein FUA48_08030 [Flavobacterium alkalisoli]|uniref:Uncharacterized protein n=1 Tax=Flavobacterium alkalisoli TaxID=2602769 RepID=A0A5B9FTI2_9FLAO|nr:DUF1796 family putative cysteine peptidase [Flavobacterium alkalisoli]QEE49529.1 hypothetical protein FUA48_08030 [Flavobacterium alkalisoli]
MRIPLIYIPRTRFIKFLYIEKSYVPENIVIPIGCDCHPAHCLKKLHIRKQSFPFDWLNTLPVEGIKYVTDNIENDFESFISDLIINQNNNIVSSHYPETEFIHEKDLIVNNETKNKLKTRSTLFLQAYKNNPVDFLFSLPVSGINSVNDIDYITRSISDFTKKIKENDRLYIYVRYDENVNENKVFSNKLFEALNNIPKVNSAKYVRYFNKYGLWGNPSAYPDLIEDLKIPIQKTKPKIYIK